MKTYIRGSFKAQDSPTGSYSVMARVYGTVTPQAYAKDKGAGAWLELERFDYAANARLRVRNLAAASSTTREVSRDIKFGEHDDNNSTFQ